MKRGIGQPEKRVEDVRFLTGTGTFTSDCVPGDARHVAFLRSSHAHALFSLAGLDRVRAMPGVRGVFAAPDFQRLGALPCLWTVGNADGSLTPLKPYPVIADGEVFHVGDIMALVAADTAGEAREAVEAIGIEWLVLASVVELPAAVAPGAPEVFSGAPGNIAYDNHFGDRAATDSVFDEAAHVVRLTVVNNRVIANYIEPRAAIAEFLEAEGRFSLRATSQGVHLFKDKIAEMLRVPEDRLHVVTPDVGGGFGTKTLLYREYPLLLETARLLGGPTSWVASRSEHFIGDAHGRDNLTVAEMALDADGRFLAMRLDILGNLGGYLSQTGPYVAYVGASMATGPYDIETVFVRVRGVYTHTAPVDAYRGAGNPEATYVLERLVDRCANHLSMAPERLRARNFVRAEQMPYVTPTGRTYDVGRFGDTLDAALRLADREGFEGRRRASTARGRLRGFGMTTYVECTAWGAGETGSIQLDRDGDFTILIGTQSTGQGHETAYAQVASLHLCVPIERIRVVQGDSARVETGAGTGGSRSIPVGAVMVDRAAQRLVSMVKVAVAGLFQAVPETMEVVEGGLREVTSGRIMTYLDIARLVEESGQPLVATASFSPPDATYPNGTHCCEIELDPMTGEIWVLRYSVADDFGVTLNPLLLEGQIHGGVAQGLGQALYEGIRYGDDGSLLTRDLMSYGLPRARNLPGFAIETRNVPSATNPLGMKGAGEAGSVAASPAVINAISDAISNTYGDHTIDMPATPFAVFTAIENAKRRVRCD